VRHRVRAAGFAWIGVSVALLLGAPQAPAKLKPITGKLSRAGYTVIALAADGRVRAVQTQGRDFSLRPRARLVTLHLRGADGVYAGPIVVARRKRGRRVILGVVAGAKLGKISVKPRRGYARVKRKLPERLLVASRRARARKGAPIGAGNFGRVRSRNVKRSAPGDSDLDGVAEPLDVDDDGDLIFDGLDRSPGALASAAGGADHFAVNTLMAGGLDQTTNANAGSSDQEIDAALPGIGTLGISILAGDLVELDCGGLVYCSTGGTGRTLMDAPFPECCDLDGDGFGTLSAPPGEPPGMFIRHGANSDQIGTGNVLIERVTTGGVETDARTDTVQYIFATMPALTSFTDEAGTVTDVSYPVAGPLPGPPGPGVVGNGFPVADGGDAGDEISVTLTFWRPQRKKLKAEPGKWIDIGGLNYIARGNDSGGPSPCPQSSFSEPSAELTALTPADGFRGFRDGAGDAAADPANTLSYKLNLTECLGGSFAIGEERKFDLAAISPNLARVDAAGQAVYFEAQ
jgi:hypothetical protein